MINPSELRRGSIINTPSGELDVYEILKGDVGIHPRGENPWIFFPYELCNPICLTDEWFSKFSFEKNNDPDRVRDEYYIRKHDVGMLIDKEKENDYYMYHETKLYFVHQLQNLYFALNGEELTIQA